MIWRKQFGLYNDPAGDPGGGNGGGGNPPAGDPPAGDPPPASWALPESLKDDAAIFETFKDKPIDDVLVAFRDLSKHAAEYAIPATPKEYAVKPPALPEGATLDQAAFDTFLGQMHAAGVPAASVQKLIDAEAADAKAADEAAKVEIAKADNALKAEWGDKYPANREAVVKLIETLPEDMKSALDKSGMREHPFTVKLLHMVAAAQAEGTLHTGDSGGTGTTREQRMYPTMFPKK